MKNLPTRESDVEELLVEGAKAAGHEVRKVKWLGRNGAPDRVLFKNGDRKAVARLRNYAAPGIPEVSLIELARLIVSDYIVWPEVKAPGLAALFPHTPHERKQAREHKRMRDAGQTVVVVDSEYQIQEIL